MSRSSSRPAMSRRSAGWIAVASLWLLAGHAPATTLPPGFQEDVVFSGLHLPTVVRFAADGRVFVAEKSGLVKVFSSLADPTPDVAIDLRTNVFSYWDRGLLGLALDPSFPAQPYVYVLYTYNALPGGTAPQWPTIDGTDDTCPGAPGATTDGCVVTARLSRLQVNASNQQVGAEQVLIDNDWCQQFPSHSIGDLAFGPDGALYVSAGDGASFTNADWGQFGGTLPNATTPVTPRNPCGDPPVGVGGVQSAPTSEGGALRSQDLRTPGDPLSLDGTILRLDPSTGQALPDNPLWGGGAIDDDRIVAYGLRNPFRMTVRPGTGELWIGEVGWGTWEEIDRIVAPTDLGIANFGWPCFEGNPQNAGYSALNVCQALYSPAGQDAKPYYAYEHGAQPGDPACQGFSSSISGLAFYTTGSFPAHYRDALFFADFSRACIWSMLADPSGLPDPGTVQSFAVGAAGPVAMEAGPGGLFYVDHMGGTVRRIRYSATNQTPTAVIQASATYGLVPLAVQLDGSASSDPDPGDVLTYAWDLDGDGQLDDSTAPAPAITYTSGGNVTVRLRVTDSQGASDEAQVTISPNNTPPAATITSPSPLLTWRVGDAIPFAGTGTDAQDGALPPQAFSWRIVLHHCPAFDCHAHTVQAFGGLTSGTVPAPDHEYPSYLEIVLTVTDAGGLTASSSVSVYPQTTTLHFQSVPSGLTLAAAAFAGSAPFDLDVIVGSQNALVAPSPQAPGGVAHGFVSWSDGLAQSHVITAGTSPQTFVATFAPLCGNGVIDAGETCDDGNTQAGDCCTPACQLVAAGAVCRAATDVCDVTETCTGAATCPIDGHLPDADDDGLCDLIDPCTGGAPLSSARLKLRNLGAPAGDDRLTWKGLVTLPLPFMPPLDPLANGARLLVTDSLGATVLDVMVPGGFDATAGQGWQERSPLVSWRYRGSGAVGGITRIVLRRDGVTGLKFAVTGKDGTYPLDPTRLPLRATYVVDPPIAATGQCGTAAFAADGCKASGSGRSVRCR